MSSQSGSIRRYIVSHKLTKDRPTSRCVSQAVGRVIDISAITETARASEFVQKLFIGSKRRKLGKHPRIGRWAKRGINRYFGSCERQAVTSDRCGRSIHESFPFRCRPCHWGPIAQPPDKARRFSMRRSGINQMIAAITRTARAIHDERSVAMTATIYNTGDSFPFQSRPRASFTIEPSPACECLPAGGDSMRSRPSIAPRHKVRWARR
jgi:hypothetical protein